MPPPPRLTDLPPSLLSLIAQSLSTLPASPRIPATLTAAPLAHQPLPEALLPLATSSPHLLRAVADALGPRASYLTARSAGEALAQWVHALSPYIHALSLLTPTRAPPPAAARALSAAATATPSPPLRSLELPVTAFVAPTAVSDLDRLLLRSARTLRELRLPSIPPVLHALHKLPPAALPSLSVFHAAPADRGYPTLLALIARACPALSELRFDSEHVTHSDLDGALPPALLENVTRVRVQNCDQSSPAMLADVFNFFPALVELHWDGYVCEGNVAAFLSRCLRLKDVHLWQWNGFDTRWGLELRRSAPDQAAAGIRLLTGRLRTFCTRDPLTKDLTDALIASSSTLNRVACSLVPECLPHIKRLLLACRGIRRIDLRFLIAPYFTERDVEKQMLHAAGWSALADAISASSDELSEVSVQFGTADGYAEDDEDAMVAAMASIMRSLGVNAKMIRLQMPMLLTDYGQLMPRLVKLLSVAAECNPNLEQLELKFCMRDVPWAWKDEAMRECVTEQLSHAMRKMRASAPKLHRLDLDGVEARSGAVAVVEVPKGGHGC